VRDTHGRQASSPFPVQSLSGQGAEFGPVPPPELGVPPANAPDWVKDLYQDAEFDEEVKEVLIGTDGDPEKIRAKMRDANDRAAQRLEQARKGTDEPTEVIIREVDTMNLWIWLRMWNAPSEKEVEMLSAVVESWFMLGKLGGFNSSNLQLFFRASEDISHTRYDMNDLDRKLPGFMHEVSEVETRGEWCRFWVDMGTADEMALDVLINAMSHFSQEYSGIRTLAIGGVNEDWTEGTEGKAAYTSPKRASIDPMRGSLPTDRADQEDLDEDVMDLFAGQSFSVQERGPRPEAGRRRAPPRGARNRGGEKSM